MRKRGRCAGPRYSWYTGVQENRAPGGPQPTRSLLTTSKGRGMSGGETRKEFISVKPTPGRQWTGVSKTVLQSAENTFRFIRKMGGQQWVGTYSWSKPWLSWSQSWAGSCWLREDLLLLFLLNKVVSVPIKGCFALWVFGLSQETS